MCPTRVSNLSSVVSTSPQLPVQPETNIQLIKSFFEDPGSVTNSDIQRSLQIQFQNQVEKFYRFTPDDNHYFCFKIEQKTYEVYCLKDHSAYNDFIKGGNTSFMTEEGSRDMSVPGGRGGSDSSNAQIFIKNGLSKLVHFVLVNEFSLSLSDEQGAVEVYSKLHNMLKNRTTINEEEGPIRKKPKQFQSSASDAAPSSEAPDMSTREFFGDGSALTEDFEASGRRNVDFNSSVPGQSISDDEDPD